MKVLEFYTQLKNVYDLHLKSKPLEDISLTFSTEVIAEDVEGEYIPPGSGTYDEPPEVFAKNFTYVIGNNESFEMSIDGLKVENNKLIATMYIVEYDAINQNKYDYLFSEEDYIKLSEILNAFKELKLSGNEELVFMYNDKPMAFKSPLVKNNNIIEFESTTKIKMSEEMYTKLADENYESSLDNFMNPEPWYDDSDEYDD